MNQRYYNSNNEDSSAETEMFLDSFGTLKLGKFESGDGDTFLNSGGEMSLTCKVMKFDGEVGNSQPAFRYFGWEGRERYFTRVFVVAILGEKIIRDQRSGELLDVFEFRIRNGFLEIYDVFVRRGLFRNITEIDFERVKLDTRHPLDSEPAKRFWGQVFGYEKEVEGLTELLLSAVPPEHILRF